MTAVSTSLLIRSDAASIYEAFVEPKQLTRFWLAHSSGPLVVGEPVTWEFLVPGASTITTAFTLKPGRTVAFKWDDGLAITVALTEAAGETEVTVSVEGLTDFQAIADVIGGFTFVLSDLKVLLETGSSPGILSDKARLIVRKQTDL